MEDFTPSRDWFILKAWKFALDTVHDNSHLPLDMLVSDSCEIICCYNLGVCQQPGSDDP